MFCLHEEIEDVTSPIVLRMRDSHPQRHAIECVRCHAIEYKIKNHAPDKVKKLWYYRR